jgi:putative endonuclease
MSYFYVYILQSKKDKLFYIGYTNNIKRRFRQHQNGESKATAPRRPFELIFYEVYTNKQDARRREKYFKTTAGKKALKLMLRKTLESR